MKPLTPLFMRKMSIITCVVLITLLARCATQKKIEFNIPGNWNNIQKEELRVNLERGMALYKPNCSKCHGIFKKGKDGIPNFTAKQLDLYRTRHSMRDSSNHAFAIKMSADDLNAVINFLTFRKGAEPVAQSVGDGQ
jgi:mono/diheme cytochrome c family protein